MRFPLSEGSQKLDTYLIRSIFRSFHGDLPLVYVGFVDEWYGDSSGRRLHELCQLLFPPIYIVSCKNKNTINSTDLLGFIFCNGSCVGAQERRAYLADTLHATHDCSLELDSSCIGKKWEHKLRTEELYMKYWREEVCGVACEGSSLKVLGVPGSLAQFMRGNSCSFLEISA